MIVFRRELRTLVTSPQAWAIATAYLLISGLFFVTLLFSRPYADLERYYTNIETTLIVVAPILAMRSFAEERRSGVLDITLSWPVSRWTLVVGKWAANTVFMWGMVSIAWLYMALLQSLGRVELGNAAAGWMGLLVLAACSTPSPWRSRPGRRRRRAPPSSGSGFCSGCGSSTSCPGGSGAGSTGSCPSWLRRTTSRTAAGGSSTPATGCTS